MTLKIDAKCEEKLTFCYKNDKNLVKFDPSPRKSPKLHFHLFLLCKALNVLLKTVQRSYLSWNWRVMENLKKTDLRFGKRHKYGKFSPEYLKVSKLGLGWDPLTQSRKIMSLKFTEELRVMTMKNDTKIEEEFTCCFKIDISNFTNFYPSTRTSKTFVF